MKLYVLLPIFNEVNNLEGLFRRIDAGVTRHHYSYEIIAYDDGSTDGSTELLQSLQASYPLHLIGLRENRGLGAAFKSLIKEVCSRSENEEDIAVVFDADNSHNPEMIDSMIKRIHRGYDVVIASRYLADSRVVGLSAFRQFLSFGASWLMRLAFPIKGVRDYACGYRAYSVGILRRALRRFGDDFVVETGFACMAEFLIKLRAMSCLVVEVPLILRYDQKMSESKIRIARTVLRTLYLLVRLRGLGTRA